MAKMSSMAESCLLFVVKITAGFLKLLPYNAALGVMRILSSIAFYFMPKKRQIIYGNLKIAFGATKTPKELNRLTKDSFVAIIQNIMDILYLPKIKADGYEKYVHFEDKAVVDAALKQNKGMIFLAIHSGSWELASLVGSSLGYTYNIVAHEQSKTPQIDAYLNQCRAVAGAKIIAPGTGVTRDIIRALQHNEIVSLVLDQGGKEGMPIDFLGKSASLATGALRLGLKYQTPVCPVWIVRGKDGKHTLKVLKPLNTAGLDDSESSIKKVATQAAGVFESLLKDHPHEFLWFYKFYKYSNDQKIVILDDGRVGHLRQSQAAASKLIAVLKNKDKRVDTIIIDIDFQSPWKAKLFAFYAGLISVIGLGAQESELEFFLTKTSYKALHQHKADWLISSGSSAGGLNFFLKRCYDVRAVCILKAGLVNWRYFDLVIAPEHDKKANALLHIVFTKAALNLIAPHYLREQEEQLLNQYSHLKKNVRFKIGVLLGGNTKGVAFNEGQIRLLLSKIKEAASHYNADILITTSRRTPPDVEAVVVKELKNFDRGALTIIANVNNSPNAVGGILSLSDLLIVSGESISMVSEALSSGKRTIVFRPEGNYDDIGTLNKFDRFVLSLSDQGFILACSIREISSSIAKMMTTKITLKTLQDNTLVQKAFERMVP